MKFQGDVQIQDVIQYGLRLPRSNEEIQRLWGELLEFYEGVLVQQKGLEKIRPGLEKLHHYFHDTFESQLFESELQLRWQMRKLKYR